MCFSGEDISLHEEKLRLQIGDEHFYIKVSDGETACLHGEGVCLQVCSSPINVKARVSATIKIFGNDSTAHSKFNIQISCQLTKAKE